MFSFGFWPIGAGFSSGEDTVADSCVLVAAIEHYPINTLPTFPVSWVQIFGNGGVGARVLQNLHHGKIRFRA